MCIWVTVFYRSCCWTSYSFNSYEVQLYIPVHFFWIKSQNVRASKPLFPPFQKFYTHQSEFWNAQNQFCSNQRLWEIQGERRKKKHRGRFPSLFCMTSHIPTYIIYFSLVQMRWCWMLLKHELHLRIQNFSSQALINQHFISQSLHLSRQTYFFYSWKSLTDLVMTVD